MLHLYREGEKKEQAGVGRKRDEGKDEEKQMREGRTDAEIGREK